MPSSSIRHPRLLATVNGAALANPVSARVASNAFHAADRFALVAALGTSTPADWLSADRMAVSIAVSLDGVAQTLIEGEADQVALDPIRRTATLTGRDLTARLIEARTQESFANQTASDIATLLAGRRGLSAHVARTATPVGRYWQLQRDQITLDRFSRTTTEWDLLVTLAQLEGFDAWVAGTTLHFQPRQDHATPAATLTPDSLLALRLDRALALARDIEVVVKSWNARQQRSFLRRARRSRGGDGAPQRYVFVVPNLTPDDALRLAQRKLDDLTRHERTLHADMPGDLHLAPRQRLRLAGTGTDFDQEYRIDEIDRSLHPTHGFTQTLRARTSGTGNGPSGLLGR